MLDWWTGLPWKWRMGVALGVIGLGALLWLSAVWVRGGFVLGAAGVAMLLFSFPSNAERRGYHDM